MGSKAKTKAAPLSDGGVSTTKAPRKPKTPSLSPAQKFEVMRLVKDADSTIPDATLAKGLSVTIGRAVSQQIVTEARKAFGISSLRRPTVAELEEYVEVCRTALREAGLSVPVMAYIVHANMPRETSVLAINVSATDTQRASVE